ncbi:MAG: asparagine synthase (glutamine-hydrolyzing) [Bacteroidota bacterium]|nr:asparagine synthase (glutamine-hydrolyzing) [Bacteroidota bacterium]
MCGINGILSKSTAIDPIRFDAMRDTLTHRGPDGAGTWIHKNQQIAFGHRRLAFMDLSETGAQPMKSSDEQIIITVNGEIYNYPELKEELAQAGHHFQSTSDSEVIIHAWKEWKLGMLEKLNGMFAFALWDNQSQELLLARDRFGIKPLYYHHSEDQVAFASEIKAIISYFPELKAIRKASIADFFSYRYIPSPYTIYQDIHKLEPGSFLLIDKASKTKSGQYYHKTIETSQLGQNDITEQLHSLLKQSVKMHTQSDVPIGSFLSGGYDSSAIVQMLHENNYTANTFSIGFENWQNSEDQYAKLVAEHFNMPHFSHKAKSADLDLLPHLLQHYDEPIADISIIPTYLVSKLAVQHNKAVLSGEGADELFAGYTWHYENLQNNTPFNRILKSIKRRNTPAPFSVEAYSQAMAMGHLRNVELQALFTDEFASEIPKDSDWFYRQEASHERGLNRYRKMDMRCFMGELVLTKIDRASMANSLEVRVPFLENNLVDFMLSLPEKKLYKKGYKKFQLHEIVKKQMPPEILQRNKQGFVGPDKYYQNASWYKSQIENATSCKDGIIEKSELKRYLSQHEYWKLWKFVVFETWYKTWI